MEDQFRSWVKDICSVKTDLIAIDGKTIRGAKTGSKSLFHMVSAFCTANGVSLAQVKTSEKSNEITAIPLLIETLDLKGCMTSIYAMGCQETIVKKIREKEGDYLLAVKNNRRDLFQSIEDTFRLQPEKEEDFATELDTYDISYQALSKRLMISTAVYVHIGEWFDTSTFRQAQ